MKTLMAKTSFLSFSTLIFLSFARTALADCLVTNTNDSGSGSLRQAIMDSNNQLCAGRIDFDIDNHDAGPFSIAVLPTSMGGGGPLPIISNPVTIDGFTPLLSLRRKPFSITTLRWRQPEQHNSTAQKTAFDSLLPVLVGSTAETSLHLRTAEAQVLTISIFRATGIETTSYELRAPS